MQKVIVVLTILTAIVSITYVITWVFTHSKNVRSLEFRIEDSCLIPPSVNFEELFEIVFKKGKCDHKEILGNTVKFDSSKYVCMERNYKFQRDNCIVLSIGIGDDLTFEKDINKFGCKVYVFDPNSSKHSLKNSSKFQMFNLSLNDFTRWEDNVGIFENILERVNLTGEVIDFLKVDIQGSEVEFLEDVLNNSPFLLNHVKQFAMEIYMQESNEEYEETENLMDKDKYNRFYGLWQDIQSLKVLDFEMVNIRSDANVDDDKIPNKRTINNIRYEILYINNLFV
ncbi:UNVERIFIED_CONTAM: hypothetical protein RMT77_004219 [Armadillidium vulgare]